MTQPDQDYRLKWARLGIRLEESRQLPTPRQRRSFAAAKTGRLTSGWVTTSRSADSDLRMSLRALRARSRQLCNDNEYAKRFISQVKNNVIGATGITLQNKARDPDGKLDRDANRIIEAAFARWSKVGQFDVTGKLSRHMGELLFIETVARDGEFLGRIHRGYDNDSGFALQYLDPDYLDETLNIDAHPVTGNQIRMGVEVNAFGKPVAYHLYRSHPGDDVWRHQGQLYERVPAANIIHCFIPYRAQQTRGVPWMHAAMIALNDLGGYREAAIIAARTGAAKMGFYYTEDGDSELGDGEDANGNLIMESEPGAFEQLPDGTRFETYDPTYPHDQFDAFNKAVLRGIAGGFGVAYNSFANDLEGVNFSSIRAGTLEERDGWMVIQRWMTESFCDAIFPEWLKVALLRRLVSLPPSKFEKWNAATWQPRRWQWVDPLKDGQANKLKVDELFASRGDIIRESGHDPEDVWDEIARENEYLAELGLEPRSNNQQVTADEHENGNPSANSE